MGKFLAGVLAVAFLAIWPAFFFHGPTPPYPNAPGYDYFNGTFWIAEAVYAALVIGGLSIAVRASRRKARR